MAFHKALSQVIEYGESESVVRFSYFSIESSKAIGGCALDCSEGHMEKKKLHCLHVSVRIKGKKIVD